RISGPSACHFTRSCHCCWLPCVSGSFGRAWRTPARDPCWVCWSWCWGCPYAGSKGGEIPGIQVVIFALRFVHGQVGTPQHVVQAISRDAGGHANREAHGHLLVILVVQCNQFFDVFYQQFAPCFVG